MDAADVVAIKSSVVTGNSVVIENIGNGVEAMDTFMC
uniref:Uncharacterized protein n=1 Tax=Peronospora matthiolae TaxID=2874970 RepID=A0AAV1VK79_9STRA